jgi:hypothetical protein
MNIWSKWEDHYREIGLNPDDICKDGIINESHYQGASSKLLFILRETNDYAKDLRELLKNGPKYQMWHTVARWASGLLRDFPDYEEIDKYDIMTESIKQIACINLKKKLADLLQTYR